VIASPIHTRLLRMIGAATSLAIALIGVTAVSGVAHASCAGSPSLSPYGFTGTVVRLGADDRQAFVQKDDGTQVEVDGGVLGPAVSGEDFDFVLGARYQIEPENSKPPFLVNDCTATTRLGLTSPIPSPSASASTPLSSPVAAPATAELTVFPTSSAQPDFLTGAVFVVIFGLLLAFAFAVRVVRRRRRHRWD
jgi:hypothetical protein